MFEGVMISETAKTALRSACAERRLPHAIVLEGTDGENRLAAAYEIAAALVCSGDTPPCGECAACRKSLKHAHPDITVLQKNEKKAFYSVDDVRAVKTDAYIIPGEAECKVYIFTEAQYLNVISQNALLKLIEEPPAGVYFILTCESVSSLLETVRSRAPAFSLGETACITEGDEGIRLALRLMQCLCAGNEAEFMADTASLEKDKSFFAAVLDGLELCLRDIIVLKSGGKTALTDKGSISKLSSRLSSAAALELLEKVRAFSQDTQYNLNQNLAVTRLCSVLFLRG